MSILRRLCINSGIAILFAAFSAGAHPSYALEHASAGAQPIVLAMAEETLSSSPAGESPQETASKEIMERIEGKTPEQQAAYLLEAKSSGEDSAELNFFLGVAMYAVGKLDSAAIFFREAVAKDSTYSRAYVNLGITLDSQGKFVEAEAMYKRALKLDPKDVLAYCHLGYLYYSRGRQGEAIAHYLKAIAVDPKSAQAHYNLGLAFADSQIFKEALHEWQLVIELDPDGDLGMTARENVGLIKQYLEMDVE